MRDTKSLKIVITHNDHMKDIFTHAFPCLNSMNYFLGLNIVFKHIKMQSPTTREFKELFEVL